MLPSEVVIANATAFADQNEALGAAGSHALQPIAPFFRISESRCIERCCLFASRPLSIRTTGTPCVPNATETALAPTLPYLQASPGTSPLNSGTISRPHEQTTPKQIRAAVSRGPQPWTAVWRATLGSTERPAPPLPAVAVLCNAPLLRQLTTGKWADSKTQRWASAGAPARARFAATHAKSPSTEAPARTPAPCCAQRERTANALIRSLATRSQR